MPNPNWVKGKSGNPNGRPPTVNSLSDVLRRKLEELDENGVPRKERIAERLLMLAEHADSDAVVSKSIKDIFDRLEGSPKQTVEASVTERREIDTTDLSDEQRAALAALAIKNMGLDDKP